VQNRRIRIARQRLPALEGSLSTKWSHTGTSIILQGKIAAVFQEDRFFQWRTALDNVRLGLELLGVPESEQAARAKRWLDALGLDGFANSYPHQLSGGMSKEPCPTSSFRPESDSRASSSNLLHVFDLRTVTAGGIDEGRRR